MQALARWFWTLDSFPGFACDGVEVSCSFEAAEFPGAMGPEMTGDVYVPWGKEETLNPKP